MRTHVVATDILASVPTPRAEIVVKLEDKEIGVGVIAPLMSLQTEVFAGPLTTRTEARGHAYANAAYMYSSTQPLLLTAGRGRIRVRVYIHVIVDVHRHLHPTVLKVANFLFIRSKR